MDGLLVCVGKFALNQSHKTGVRFRIRGSIVLVSDLLVAQGERVVLAAAAAVVLPLLTEVVVE